MSTNFHTAWIDSVTLAKPSSLNPVWSDLDRAITYLKNIIVHQDGDLTYSKITGRLIWSDHIRIIFNRADGQAIQNIINAGTIVLNDNQMAYITLNETDGTVLTMTQATINFKITSGFIAYNRLVIGYRNTASDCFFSQWLPVNPDKLVQAV